MYVCKLAVVLLFQYVHILLLLTHTNGERYCVNVISLNHVFNMVACVSVFVRQPHRVRLKFWK